MEANEKVMLKSNIFCIEYTPFTTFQYDFRVSNNMTSSSNFSDILQAFIRLNRHHLADCYIPEGSQRIISPQTLCLESLESTVIYQDQTYEISIQGPAREYLLEERDLFQVILHFTAKHYRQLRDYKNSFYDTTKGIITLPENDIVCFFGFDLFNMQLPLGNLMLFKSRVTYFDRQWKCASLQNILFEDYEQFNEQCKLAEQNLLNWAREIKNKLQTSGLSRFGVSLKPVNLEGQVCKSPSLVPTNLEGHFYRAASGSFKWALFSFNSRHTDQELARLQLEFTRKAHQRGLQLSQCVLCLTLATLDSVKQIQHLFKISQLFGAEFLLIGLPSEQTDYESDPIYMAAQYYSSQCQFNMPIECFSEENLDDCISSNWLDTLVARINDIFGGQARSIDLSNYRTMYLDSSNTMLCAIRDSYLPTKLKLNLQFTILSGSMNNEFNKYETICKQIIPNQDPPTESMLAEMMERYYCVNGRYPTNLIFYRFYSKLDKCNDEFNLLKRVTRRLNVRCKVAYILISPFNRVRVQPSDPTILEDEATATSNEEKLFSINERLEFKSYSFYTYRMNYRLVRFIIYKNELLPLMTDPRLQRLSLALCYFQRRRHYPLEYPLPLDEAMFQGRRLRFVVEGHMTVHEVTQLPSETFGQIIEKMFPSSKPVKSVDNHNENTC